jgi:hypothetical protein
MAMPQAATVTQPPCQWQMAKSEGRMCLVQPKQDRFALALSQDADLDLGLADASVAVLAGRYGVRDILTLDERHFRTLRGPGGRPFRLLPADA